MVSGVRVKRQDTASRRLASRLGNGFRNALLNDGATDTGCGLKAFRRDAFLDAALFRSHPPLPDRAGAARGLEGGALCRSIIGPRLTGRSKYTNLGRLLVSVQDLLGVRWLQRRHGGRTKVEEL